MDIRNYTWISSFEPTSVTTETEPESTNLPTKTEPESTQSSSNDSKNSQSNNSELNNQLVTMKILMASIGGIVGAIVIITGIVGYRWYHNKQIKEQSKIMRIPGNINHVNV